MSQLFDRSLSRDLRRCRDAVRSRSSTVAAGIIVVAVGAFLASCTPDKVTTPAPGLAPSVPLFDATVPFNDQGACLAADAFASGHVQGVNSATTLADNQHCTSNDISIASADVLGYSFDENATSYNPIPPGGITCVENTAIFLQMAAHVKENASSQRTDIGIWIAADGGNARTGVCNHYNLLANGVFDFDHDQCGDMNNAAEVTVPLGVIDAVCKTSGSNSNFLHIGSCLGWTEPGDNESCPVTATDGSSLGPNGFRWGTVPGNTSKCNCGGFDVPITVKRTAKLEVVKACTPTTDGGTFDLLIDGSNGTDGAVIGSGDNVACGGRTGAKTVDAGTNTSPGAVHTFGEGDFATANYTSSYSCVNRVGTPPQHVFTAAGDAAATGTSLGPNQITLQPNEDVVCTYTNVRRPSLTLVKVVTNDNGGTKTLSDFPLTATGPVTISGVSGESAVTGRTVDAGSYALTEQTQAGYGASSWSCTGGTQTGSSIALAGGGGGATCTISNNDNGPTLTLVKTISNDNGGSKTLSDFPLTASGPVTISGVSGQTAVTGRVVSAGSYALTEQTQDGYTASSWTCTGGSQTGTNIALALGGAATCTINNDDVAPTLTLVKTVTNDNGGTKTVSDFSLTASGPVTISGVTGAPAVTGASVKAGSYALTEQTQAGYNASAWSCTGGTQAGSNIGLALGGAATCTINNNDIGATLTLVKTVTNDAGGSKTLSDFPLTATGPVTINGVSGETAVTGRSVNAGTYALTEQTQAGYEASNWTCTGTGTQTGTNIALALGGAATCTINNNDIAPTLTLVKTVTNDAGGSKTLSDFPLTATGPVTISGVSASTAVTNRPVKAGSYALTEQTQTGYTASAWTCTGGTQNGANIALALGGAATCTINNDDVAPTLTLVKTVTNDAGGSKTLSDFPLTASGPVTISGVSGETAVTNRIVNAGSYVLSEQTQAGYAASAWSCTGATLSGTNLTLASGGAATCTINNNDIAPTLTLVKTITNDHGGTKTLSDFPLTASGPVTISGVSASTAITNRPVTAGSYALTEQTQTGYAASAWGCTGGTLTGSNIALALGGAATCTINNNDIPGTIIIEKEVTDHVAGSFTFSRTLASGAADAGDNAAPSLVDGGSSSSGAKLVAGSYKVCETNLGANWADPQVTGVSLSGDGFGNFCMTFTLAIGETKTIHFVNHLRPPGGGTRTIGYWKNWSSCAGSNGGQYLKATNGGNAAGTLDYYLPTTHVPSIYDIGKISSLTCSQAVNLLSKSSLDGTARSGDPIYGMVAQLLGAKINKAALATTCTALNDALGPAQTLLLTLNFDGTKSYTAKNALTSAQITQANSLAATFDKYNQGTLGGGCPTHF